MLLLFRHWVLIRLNPGHSLHNLYFYHPPFPPPPICHNLAMRPGGRDARVTSKALKEVVHNSEVYHAPKLATVRCLTSLVSGFPATFVSFEDLFNVRNEESQKHEW